ncbi:MAG: peptidoglycan DD-metalloendopeptidase family protein [Coriobacteriia bacterium]|nr:peptidoglycan DD-metalloendopeptidase family protein [Coriobacteriia bacterium]
MHRTRSYCAIILSLALLLGSVTSTYAVTSSDLTAAQQAAETARQQAAAATALANQLKAETQSLDKQVDALQADADALDPQIAEATARTNQLEADVARLRAEITSKTAEIETNTKNYAQQQELLAQRVSSTYRQGSWFYLELLLSSSNIRDLIAHTELVARVIRSNSDAAAQLVETKAALVSAKSALDNALAEISVKRDEARAAQASVQQLQDARQGKVNQQASVLAQKSSLLAATNKNVKQLTAIAEAEEAESARIAAELSGGGSGQFNGVMTWPTPSCYTITSSFGWRMHPVLHVNKLHTGIDIGASAGAAIVAAGAGTVISTSYLTGYGYTVMIDHGNGVVTLYAHQPSGGIQVSVGQRVTKGQRIGTVGSTGYATGPHLHFEVRINGNPVDPMPYLR